ncbi:MFS transporter [Mangrovihabitans endophyticus]|uniref:MFS transporter n=1 Tax=Mangrovihabitans endophyticus TaxID=1751298 RepID=UPI00166B174D|nr:MFS transporter [Mangrovihabitans endophyticus]
MIVAVLMVCSFAVATAEFVLVGLLPQIAADVGVPVGVAGQLVTVYMLVGAVGGPVAAVVTRRVPRRGLLAATMALAVVSALWCAVAGSYGALMAARAGSALAQALFMAVASQVLMAAVPERRRTAAVARLFGGFALATVAGLPLGALVGAAYGWRVTFVAVAALAGAGLVGVWVAVPRLPVGDPGGLASSVRAVLGGPMLAGLAVTLLALTGFVAVFTYVVPVLRAVAGFGPGWVGAALAGYGVGTVAGNLIAGRVAPARIGRWLPAAVAALAVVLLVQDVVLRSPLALAGPVLMGGAAFVVVPLVQTWLMGRAGPAAAGLAAAVNVSVAGAAGALGAALGGVVLSVGWGPLWLAPVAAVPAGCAVVAALLVAASDRARRDAVVGAGG